MRGTDSGAPGSRTSDQPNYVAQFAGIQLIFLAFQDRRDPCVDPADRLDAESCRSPATQLG